MSDTPKTDALREVVIGQYKEDELTGNGMGNILAALTDIETLERERECECKCDVDWPEEYYELRQRLERERDAERALADRLHGALKGIWPFIEEDIPHGCNSTAYMNAIELCRANITAWKEARSE